MYAVVDIKGFQYRLEKGDTLRVPKFDLEVGKKIKLSDVLLVVDDETYTIGQPYVEGGVVEATVTGQGKYDKILVFKKKRRKDYSVKRGHRQDYTEISVDHIKISKKKSKKPDEETPEAAEPAAVKPEAEEPVTEAVEIVAETAEAAEKPVKKAKPVRKKKDTAKSSARKPENPEAEKS